jgi:dihydrofolate synthase / folylpolyglutamate synthase
VKTTALRTHRIECKESLHAILDRYVPVLAENSIVVITSKIVSLCQGRVLPKPLEADPGFKEALIQQEADSILKTSNNPYGIYLTLKNNILIPSAGIDESNGDNVYILYPEAIQQVASLAWDQLREKHAIKNLGIIISDSHTTPLRRGVTGIALGWCGFQPLYSYVGKPDLYGHPLRVTHINLLDALATAAVLVMGEGNEQSPLAVIEDAPKITFVDRAPTVDEEKSISIPIEEDLYGPLFKGFF